MNVAEARTERPLPPTPDPAPLPSGRRFRFGFALAGTTAALAALALVYLYRPEGQFFFPRCTFYQFTKLHCPGCGGLRASHELLHGEFLSAFRHNALLVAGLPILLVTWLRRRTQPGRPWFGASTVWTVFAVVIAFTVLRNLPGPTGQWFAP